MIGSSTARASIFRNRKGRPNRPCEKQACQIITAASATVRPSSMSYISGEDRGQAALLPAVIEDYAAADAPI